MQDVNAVVLVGRLTKDPELRTLGSGTAVCEFRLAFNTSKKVDGQWTDVGNFIDVSVWGNQGESVARNLSKGARVAVTGRLEHRTWEKDGQKREKHSITAQLVQFLDPRQDGAASSSQTSQSQTTPAAADDDIPY